MANENLHKAKEAKNDEFYTQLNDVSEELRHYKEHFKDKIIFCNCDDPTWSAFWRYFHLNFDHLGLKKLISTHYDKEKPTYKMEYTGGNDNDIEAGVKTPLEGNGDFRNQECIDLLKEADIVVTNPPFSIAREDFIPQLFEYKKKFLIIGDLNWVTYKIIFPLLKNNEMWMGYSAVKEFLQPDGTIKKFGNKLWFTNLDIKKRHEKLILWKNYTSAEFPRYDNYDAINVDKVSNIPCDYCESWEVTEDEFKNFSADEWEVTRTGARDGEKSFFIIPAANTELRKLLHEHAAGYKEEIEKEISKKIQKNIFIDNSNTGACNTGIAEEKWESRLHSSTNSIQNNSGLSETNTHLFSTEAEDTFMERGCTAESSYRRYCNGVLGVPITYLDKYSPEQFEIIGMLQSSTDEQAGIPNLRFYNSFREMRQDMSYTGASGGKANGNPVIKEKPKKGNFLYNEKTGEYVHSVYARIVIRRKL